MPLHEYHPTLKTATKTHFRRIIRNACRANILALSFIALESPTSSSFAPSFVLTCTKLIRTKNPLRTPFLDVALASEKSDFHDGSSGPKLIPIAQLKELKDSVDIVSAIESFGLQKFQRRDEKAASAICPFHDDHSPSLSIDGNRKIFKCFACGAGGDIFKFVREYNRLQGVEISFYQAVRDVAEKFSDNKVFFQTSRQWNRDEGKYNETQAKKERILLANAAAALFYSENLVNLPAAGRARSHLRSRGLSPTTVKAFGLGYAPDAFFQTKQHRGSGSLVEHLCSLGFSAQDLVEAGLAVVTNYTKEGLQTKGIVGLNSFNASESRESQTDESRNIEDAPLMDRFRGRLMVPILDSQGDYVLGFGGRVLTTSDEEQKSSFKAPKYLNSPESVVFQKKFILFGQQTAKKAVQSLRSDRRSVIIVEGYMDAISLWDAGVCEVVASMGTALSQEQLASAAKLVGGKGGKIILCLDADVAGVAAIERLCGSNILRATVDSSQVDLLIAALPEGIKDPAEFVERKRGENDQVGNEFRDTVISRAEEWTSWYVRRIISSGNSSDVRSFGQSFESVAEFLSTFPNPAERIRRASDVAFILTGIMAKQANASISTAVRIQLEADLIDMVSRKAAAKESLKRRIESVANSGNVSSTVTLSKFTDGLSADEEVGKLSSTVRSATRSGGDLSQTSNPKTKIARDVRERSNRRVFQAGNTRSKAKEEDHLTPHFSGFKFVNRADSDWLRLNERKRGSAELILGASLFKDGIKCDTGSDNTYVYFNSNTYHGSQLLTDSAADYGYLKTPTRRDTSILEKGVPSLIHLDPDALVLAAEDKLLRTLIINHRARSVMKHLLEVKSTAGTKVAIDWTCPEKRWLFVCLINDLPENMTIDELRTYLSQLPEAPLAAFGISHGVVGIAPELDSSVVLAPSQFSQSTPLPMFGVFSESSDEMTVEPSTIDEKGFNTDSQRQAEIVPPFANSEIGWVEKRKTGHDVGPSGCLDYLFTVDHELTGAAEIDNHDQLRIDLCVQESLSSLLWALAAKKLAETILPFSSNVGQSTSLTKQMLQESSSATTGKQDDVFASIHGVADVYKAVQNVHELHGAAKQMASKLLDLSNANVREGHVSLAKRREIEATLRAIIDEHEGPMVGHDEDADGPAEGFEEWREKIDDEWGDWADDDYEWSSGETTSYSFQAGAKAQELQPSESFEDESDETVEETIARMDREWNLVQVVVAHDRVRG